MMVNCRASSTGEISRSRILRPLGTRGSRGAGGERKPPENVRLGPSGSAVRYDGQPTACTRVTVTCLSRNETVELF